MVVCQGQGHFSTDRSHIQLVERSSVCRDGSCVWLKSQACPHGARWASLEGSQGGPPCTLAFAKTCHSGRFAQGAAEGRGESEAQIWSLGHFVRLHIDPDFCKFACHRFLCHTFFECSCQTCDNRPGSLHLHLSTQPIFTEIEAACVELACHSGFVSLSVRWEHGHFLLRCDINRVNHGHLLAFLYFLGADLQRFASVYDDSEDQGIGVAPRCQMLWRSRDIGLRFLRSVCFIRVWIAAVCCLALQLCHHIPSGSVTVESRLQSYRPGFSTKRWCNGLDSLLFGG